MFFHFWSSSTFGLIFHHFAFLHVFYLVDLEAAVFGVSIVMVDNDTETTTTLFVDVKVELSKCFSKYFQMDIFANVALMIDSREESMDWKSMLIGESIQ